MRTGYLAVGACLLGATILTGCPPREVVRPVEEPAGMGAPTAEVATDGEVIEAAADTTVAAGAGAAAEPQALLDEALEYCRAADELWRQGEMEQAVEALDRSYGLVLRVPPGKDDELERQRQDIRLMVARKLLEIQTSLTTAAAVNGGSIPLPLNETIKEQIDRFTGPEKKFFLSSLRRSGRFRPMIVSALKEAGLPEELSWLPLIESGFHVRALSRARALGLWQFIPSTGYRFGLKRDRWIDDRMDPQASTQAAIKYLKELHKLFGDWLTALAGYNCGENLVLRVIRQQNVAYLDDFWDLYERLPQETRRYAPRFLAILHLVSKPAEFGIELPEPEAEPKMEDFEIERQVELSALARLLEMPADELEELNPSLRRGVTPPAVFRLKIPAGSRDKLVAGLDKIPTYKPPEPQFVVHRIRQGDTLSALAQRYRVKVETIARANKMRVTDLLRLGQKLRIPLRPGYRAEAKGARSEPPPARKPEAEKPGGQEITVEVQAGDSLWQLARRYRTDVDSISRLNGIRGFQLQVGQQLRIRPGPPPEDASATSSSYTVEAGDTLFSIAQKMGMPLEKLLRLNGLHPSSVIRPGQQLVVEGQ